MIYLVLVSIIWAVSFGLIKGKLSGLDSNYVATARIGLAMVVFLPFLRLRGVTFRQAFALAGIGAVQYGFMYVLYTWSFRVLEAYEVALLTIMTPLYVAIIDALLEKRAIWIYVISAGLAVIGTGICIWHDIGRPGIAMGILAVQGANLCFAVGQLWYRRTMPCIKHKDRDVFALLYGGGAIVAFIAMLFSMSGWNPSLTITHLWVLGYLGVVASGWCFFLWNYGARATNVGVLAVMNNLKIPMAVLASGVIFGESVNWGRFAMGGSIIAIAVSISLPRRGKHCEA